MPSPVDVKPVISGSQTLPLTNQKAYNRIGVNQSHNVKHGMTPPLGQPVKGASVASPRQHLDTKPQLPLGQHHHLGRTFFFYLCIG